jgi:lambda family phage tail tape measure protein
VAGQSATVFGNAFNSMGDALANFATTGKLNFKGLVTSILGDLAKMEARIALSKILQSVLGAFLGSSGGNG